MGTTNPLQLPYPEPSDPVAAGADAIKALAQAIDPKLLTLSKTMIGFAWSGTEHAGIQQAYTTLTGTTAAFTVPAAPPGSTKWKVHIQGNSTFRKASGDSTAEVALRIRSSWGGATALTGASQNPMSAPGNTAIHLRSVIDLSPGSYSVYLDAWTALGYVNAGERLLTVQLVSTV